MFVPVRTVEVWMIWTRERLEHDWFIPKELWRIFDSKDLVDFFHQRRISCLYWRHSKTLRHINIYILTTTSHQYRYFLPVLFFLPTIGAWRLRRIHAEEDGLGGGGGDWEAQAGGRQPSHPRDQVWQEGPYGCRRGETWLGKSNFCPRSHIVAEDRLMQVSLFGIRIPDPDSDPGFWSNCRWEKFCKNNFTYKMQYLNLPLAMKELKAT